MGRSAAFAITVSILLCLPVHAAAGGFSASDKSMSASEFIENLPSLLALETVPPEVTEPELIALEESDPETYIFIKGAVAHPPRPVNLGGDGRLTLTRRDSGEQIMVRYRDRKGIYLHDELKKIDRIMRCSLTGKETEISLKLIEILDAIEDRFGKKGLTLLSGYRTPRLNTWLPGAARRSLHMLGWAADIRVPGTSPARVTAYARKLSAGGVGDYPGATFTHLDAGRPRHWVVQRPTGKPPVVPAR